MQNLVAFKYLLHWLGLLYAAEGRPGGDAAAKALVEAAAQVPDPLPQPYNYLPGMAEAALSHNPHGCADVVVAALPLIRWFHVTDSMQSIGADVGSKMLVTELLGPDGMVHHDTIRVGLFVQCPHLDYPARTHGAEETYIILGGGAYWGTHDRHPVRRTAGEFVFHPSFVPHRSRTLDKPTIAAWRWSGDIRYEAYSCGG
ncbi:MAG: dimethylsulfonioproprionate lyase family protein [Pseudomonadota bacterium]